MWCVRDTGVVWIENPEAVTNSFSVTNVGDGRQAQRIIGQISVWVGWVKVFSCACACRKVASVIVGHFPQILRAATLYVKSPFCIYRFYFRASSKTTQRQAVDFFQKVEWFLKRVQISDKKWFPWESNIFATMELVPRLMEFSRLICLRGYGIRVLVKKTSYKYAPQIRAPNMYCAPIQTCTQVCEFHMTN